MAELGWWTLLPSLLAIGMALLTRQVFIALFCGIWAGAWLLSGGDMAAIGQSFFRVVDTYLVQALAPEDGSGDHISIAIFTLLTGGVIGVISKNGGLQGVVDACSRFVKTKRSAQGMSAGLGGLIFFDDYANTLIVGNTMRPIIDKAGVSREKLAYIVDSTAAPMACIALITTWIGFQISLIRDTLGDTAPAFEMMLGALPYSFYPILALFFVGVVIVSGRDFGPMLKAENAVQNNYDAEVKVLEVKSINNKAYLLAIIPILTLIVATFVGLILTGDGNNIRDILGSANPFKAMMWSSLLSLVLAIILSITSGALSIHGAIEAMEEGFKPMFGAVLVLTFAWAIADINKELQTANFIISGLSDGGFEAEWLPIAIFFIAALCSFATGTSWGTIGILVPLVLPLAAGLLPVNADAALMHPVMLASLAAVLGGAVWGDHCSPISDTTILSSVASGCDHIAHVRTQMPYALVVSLVAVVCGMIPVLLMGVPLWLSFIVCAAVLAAIMKYYGRHAC